jgi:hypothetical protein
MYYKYRFSPVPKGARFDNREKVSLYGCNVGEIPRLLRSQLTPGQGEPYGWHVPIEEIYGSRNEALIIDLKPNSKDAEGSLSLYQIRDAWGFSDHGWTPGLFRLRGLVVDGTPSIKTPEDFSLEFLPEGASIYTFTQYEGTVEAGALTGKWIPQRPSSNNSALLGPDALEYFLPQMQTGCVAKRH